MIRTKTVEYSLSSSLDFVVSSSLRPFSDLIVYLPETGSRSFRNCFIEVFIEDDLAAATSVTGWKFHYKVGTGSAISSSNTVTISNTGENMSMLFYHDVTSVFSSSFGPSDLSQSFTFGTLFTGSSTTNASVRLFCTYDYDDAAVTRVKTVVIPMDSYTGGTNATSSTIIDTIPALDTYLPETGKVYRDISIQLMGNDGCTQVSAIDTTSMSLKLDQGTPTPTGPINATLNSARLFKYIWNQNGIDTTTTHSLSILSSLAGMAFNCISAQCLVTYEYNHSSSTRIMNYISLPTGDDVGVIGGTTATDRSRFQTEFLITEPAITMSRAGIYHSFMDSAAIAFLPSVTQSAYSQSVKTYNTPSVALCGGWTIGTRFDSGASGSQGMALTSGSNILTVDWYRTGAGAGSLGSSYSSYAIFNYESGKSAQSGGDANHSQVRKWLFAPLVASTTRRLITGSISLAESSSYYLTSLGVNLITYNSAPANNITLTANCSGSDDGIGFGWIELRSGTQFQDSEIAPISNIVRMDDTFRRYPTDPQTTTRLIPTRNRFYSFESSNTTYMTGYFFATYHTLAFNLTGSVSGYTGNGSGLTVNFHRSDTNELIASTTTNVGGSFQKTWYNNVIPIYAEVYQDDTHVGRSGLSTASGVA